MRRGRRPSFVYKLMINDYIFPTGIFRIFRIYTRRWMSINPYCRVGRGASLDERWARYCFFEDIYLG